MLFIKQCFSFDIKLLKKEFKDSKSSVFVVFLLININTNRITANFKYFSFEKAYFKNLFKQLKKC